MDFDLIRKLAKRDQTSKIVLLVMDGLGGLPRPSHAAAGGARVEGGSAGTALEAAATPNLDKLAAAGSCGLHVPVGPGITSGSGPAHLALFGYDPLHYEIGRGVLSALGVDFDLQPGDVAARGNFCTVDDAGRVTDRRAGRIPTEKNEELLGLLRDKVHLSGVELFLQPVKEYRFLFVLRGDGLAADVVDTDPQEVGATPIRAEASAESAGAERTAGLVRDFVSQAGEALAGSSPANMLLLRGFSQRPDWPRFPDVTGMRALAIAMYPMYRGVAKLVGMDVLPARKSPDDEIDALEAHWADYDFFFVHVKHTDSAGEDGDFDRKVHEIEATDARLPRILDLKPDVLMVTGDHSTPAAMKYHSWHPVPVVLWSRLCRADAVTQFGEQACLSGALGPRIPAVDLMPIAMANANRLEKFGA